MTDMPPPGDRPEPETPKPPEEPVAEPSAADTGAAAPVPPADAPAPAAPPSAPPSAPTPAETAVVGGAAMAATPPPPPAMPPAAPPPAVPPPVVAPPSEAWQAPPSPPPSTPEVPGAPGRYFAATITRVAAWLIDGLLVGILAGIFAAIVSAFFPGRAALDEFGNVDFFSPSFIAAGIVGLIVSYLYFFLSWRSGGKATPGQRVFRMQVGNAFDGTTLTGQQATIRWLALFGPSILAALPFLVGIGGLIALIWDIVILVTVASSATKQGIHDRWARSAVVATGPQNTGLAWGCVIILLVGAALLFVLAIALLAVIAAAIYSTLQPQ